MASSIVKSAAQQLGHLLVEEATSLYMVRDKMESLQTELEWIECFLRDADTQQHQEKVICKWVSQVRDLAYEAEDIIERYFHEVSHHRRDGVLNTLKWFSRILCNLDALTLHKLGSDIDGLTVKISELTSRLKRYGIKIIRPTGSQEYNTMIMEERRTYSHTEEVDIIGLDEDIQKVVDQLRKKDVNAVGVCGTGGLGKTTLVRKVFNHKDIKDHFNDNCAWVYISKEFEKGSIFKQILLQLEKGNEAKKKILELRVEQLPEELHKFLGEKRCLVVIDDIWTEKAWKSLKPAFESIFETTSSSKILLTTRDQGLLQQVDSSGRLHPLKHLNPEDSWELLKRKVAIGHGNTGQSDIERLSINKGDDIEQPSIKAWSLIKAFLNQQRAQWLRRKSTGGESLTRSQKETNEIDAQDVDRVKHEGDMENLGREMLKHCDGLPIAIIALGGILSNKKTISEWKDVKNNLSSYLMSDTKQGGGDQIVKILELSYHDLPFYLKPCFLYLGNFPEDYKISTHRLYHLWKGEGFLVTEGLAKKNGGTVYDVGETYLNELVQRSMVQVEKCWPSGRIKTCRVHDVMRDMCLRKCEEVGFLNYIECNKSDTPSTLPSFSDEIKKLRRCALNDENGDFIEKHFEHGERAIGLRSLLVFKDQNISRKAWKCFPLLRVLDLEGIDLEYVGVDGVGYLIHLRYLNLRKTGLQVLPSSLYDLKYLETLDLRCEKYSEITLCNRFDKMKKLRHLYLPEQFVVEGGENLKFPIGGQMETITNFDPERCETKALMQMTNLRVFSVRKRHTFTKKEEVEGILEAPVMKNEGQLIKYFNLTITGDVLHEEGPMLLSSSIPDFNGLTIEGHHTSITGVVFPKSLTRAELCGCEIGEGEALLSLEKLLYLKYLKVDTPVGNKLGLSAGGFPELTQLVLQGQTGLEELEVGEGALPNLQTLEISGCENLNKVSNIPDSLTTVVLCECGIGEGGALLLALEKLPRLQSLRIERIAGCSRLSFSPSSFPRLTRLQLTGLEELEEWGVGFGALPNLQRLTLSRCKKMNKWKNIPHTLTQVELDNYVVGDSVLAELEKLPCLQTLEIYEPIITVGGGNKLSFSTGSFPRLVQLFLKCPFEMEDGALPNLQRLDLISIDCDKLNTIPNSLTRVQLWCCEIKEGGGSLLSLEKLPRLQQLIIYQPKTEGVDAKKMSFSAGSFPHLTQLTIYATELEEWEVGDGALPHLQTLMLEGCRRLKKIPSGLPGSVDIECKYPCIKGIEKYNTCPYFKCKSPPANRFKLLQMSCLH